MAEATNKQIGDILGAIEELRTSVVTFEHVVSAHLDVLSEKLQRLQWNIPVQTAEQGYKQHEQNSIFAVQSPIQPPEIYEVQRLPVRPLVERQLLKPKSPSPGNTEEEESPCPLPKAFKWRKIEDKEQRTNNIKGREQAVAIPRKREYPVDDINQPSSGQTAGPLLNPQMSSQKQPKLVQLSDRECIGPPTLRSKHPSPRTNVALSNGHAQTTQKRPPLPMPEKSVSKSSNVSEPPIIKLEERRMWKTIWNAEGSKEPLDQYIIRKRSEIIYRLPKVRAKAEEKVAAGRGNIITEKAASQNRNTDNQQDTKERPKTKETTRKVISSTATHSLIVCNTNDPEARPNTTVQQTLSKYRTNDHPKVVLESLPHNDRSVCDQPAASRRSPTEDPKAKAKAKPTKKDSIRSNSNNNTSNSDSNRNSTNNKVNSTNNNSAKIDKNSTIKKKKRKTKERDLFYNSSSPTTEDTVSPKSVDLDRLMENFGAQKRIG